MSADQDAPPPPRRKRKKKSRGLGVRGIILIIFGVVFAFALLIGGGVWLAMKIGGQGATEEQIRAEREADKQEAATAFSKPEPPAAEDQAEFRGFFESLGGALRRGRADAVNRHFHAKRMVDELARIGTFDVHLPTERRAYRDGVQQDLETSIGRDLVKGGNFHWDSTRVRHVRWSDDRREAGVLVQHDGGTGQDRSRIKFRWWLVRVGGEWKAFDYENLDRGMRDTQLTRDFYHSEFKGEFDRNPTRLQAAVDNITEASVALNVRRDAAEAERHLAKVRHERLPKSERSSVEVIEGGLLLDKRDAAGALARFEAAAVLAPERLRVKVLRAEALLELKRFDEALESARAYLAALGPDAFALGQAGYALEALSRRTEALDCYRAALDDDPDEIRSLHGFRRTIPDDRKPEAVERLEKTDRKMANFDEMLQYARSDGDQAGIAVLLAWLARTKPDDIRVRTEELLQLVKAKKFPEAAARLKRELGAGTDDDRVRILNSYLFAMIDAEMWVEAYEAVPNERCSEAFRTLAYELEDSLEADEPDKPNPAAKRLGELIVVHSKRDPGDPWLNVFEGAVLRTRGEHAKADAVFKAGVVKLAARPAEPNKPGSAANRLRAGRVQCHIDLQQPLKAYAAVGPSIETFRQLANHFGYGDDPAGLEQLLAAHRKEFPNALELEFWQAELDFLNAKYEPAARGFRLFHNKANDEFPEKYRAVERCIRSWVRAGRANEARMAVAAFGVDGVPAHLRAVVEALAGDVEAVDRILAEATKNDLKPWVFYHDPDFIRLTDGAKFAALRAKYPDPRPKPPLQKAG